MEPCFPGDGWTPACRWAAETEFLPLLVCTAFTFLIKLFLFQPTSFLTFTLQSISPIPLGRVSEQLQGPEVPARTRRHHLASANAQPVTALFLAGSSSLEMYAMNWKVLNVGNLTVWLSLARSTVLHCSSSICLFKFSFHHPTSPSPLPYQLHSKPPFICYSLRMVLYIVCCSRDGCPFTTALCSVLK